jgi:D-aspartate ligase
MKEFDVATPVVVLNAKLAALGIMRSLGKKGVRVFAVDSNPRLSALRSRYCAGHLSLDLCADDTDETVRRLLEFGRTLGKKPVLFWTSDETAVLAARYRRELAEGYLLPQNDVELIDELQNKAGMHRLALRHGVPAPRTEFPKSEAEALAAAQQITFPVMVKAIIGSRLFARTGKKMELAHDIDQLMRLYREMEDPEDPNLMFQEAIPGSDDQVYIFNGYFDADSNCLNPYTGHKIRQYPVHVGCASLGICRWNEEVARITQKFMKDLGYRGILDIGYRLDPRDGKYKVLDVNPRIGQAFRIFVGTKNEDVCRDMYLDLTGQPLERSTPREGRRWMIEDFDVVSSYEYRQEGTLTFGEWLRSLKGLEEFAWWWWRDPVPFMLMAGEFLRWQIPRRLRSTIRRVRGSSGVAVTRQ